MSKEKNCTPKEKMTFLQWIDNLWYHNKAAIIIGAFAFVMIVVGLTQFISKKAPDVFIYYVGHGKLSDVASDKFKDDMQLYFADDYNGDGNVVVDYKEDAFTMVQSEQGERYVYDPSAQMTETQRFNLELGMGDCVVYIMEPAFFSANTDYVASLEEVLGYVPKNAIFGKGIPVSSLKAYKNTSLNRYPSDYIICIARKKTNFTDEYYNGNVTFFKNLVEYKVNADS
ncbi:MAG: hypothetical protein J6K12_01125 [Clostridia bacterium]|nr:hypothetical protein [Clostridia bacterium]